jgi:signal transduction histidine kinase
VRGSLAQRVTVACLLVAVLAVGVAALVALRLVAVTAREVGATVLGQQADVVAAQVADDRGRVGLRRVVDVLQGQDVAVVLIGDGRAVGDPTAVTVAERARAPSAVVEQAGTTYLVETRAAGNGSFALVRAVDEAATGLVRRNLLFAFLAGGAVAVVVGVLVGGLLARPLRRTADAARLLRTGDRDVRVPVQGPAEIAEVAGAVNELADALARSEGRQREFLLSVSHELRTPLTAVRGFGESLADAVVTGPDAVAAGRTIVDESLRLERLVTDLMELARLEADEFRLDLVDVDLTALVRAAAEVWAARCRAAGVAFTCTTPPEPVPVCTDPRRLRQVLDALADNALRVTPPGAPLCLDLRRDRTIEVRDGGPGLDPRDYPLVFERGVLHERYRGRRPVGGAGVGLALVHGLVTRLGGTVTAGPAPEGGACFTVRI